MSGLGAPSVALGPTVGPVPGAIVPGSSQSDEQSFGDVFEEARASSRASAPGEPASGSDPSMSGLTATGRSATVAAPAPGAGHANNKPSLWQPRAGTRVSKAAGPDRDKTPETTPGPVSGSTERRGLGRSPKARAGETGLVRASSGSDSTSAAPASTATSASAGADRRLSRWPWFRPRLSRLPRRVALRAEPPQPRLPVSPPPSTRSER